MAEIEQSRSITPLVPSSFSPEKSLFGKYEVGKLLGCGAFAKVYHGRDVNNGRSVAIKVINKNKIATSTTLMGNIKREITIMQRLNHPHIVKLFEVLASKTKIYFVMEFAKGGELFARIANKGRFSEDLSRKYFQQLVSAVSYCHSRGVYHRDLKPENLLLDEDANLKISDFGLSAVTDQVRHDGLLHTLCGTPAYVAPEILSKQGYDGTKVDVWSCGVILFVLGAGFLPFNDPNLMMMYKKIYKGDFKCPRWMSSDLKRFLFRLMDINPSTRITIDEIKNDPWFKKGYKEQIFYDQDFDATKVVKHDEDVGNVPLNAFDLISFSSGLDLSLLFVETCNSVQDSERFVAEGSPGKILKRIEETIKEEAGNVRLKKWKEWGVELQGPDGKFRISLEIYELTNSLVVVEVKRAAGEAIYFDELWKKKIKPEILIRRYRTVRLNGVIIRCCYQLA